jgi:hypothetical protein
MIQAGLPNNPPSPASYSNCNFSLFREILPFMVRNLQDSENPASDSANAYIAYMQQSGIRPFGHQCELQTARR